MPAQDSGTLSQAEKAAAKVYISVWIEITSVFSPQHQTPGTHPLRRRASGLAVQHLGAQVQEQRTAHSSWHGTSGARGCNS